MPDPNPLTVEIVSACEMNMAARLSPPQRPLSCCFNRKGFLAVGLGRGKKGQRTGNAARPPKPNITQIKKFPIGASAEERGHSLLAWLSSDGSGVRHLSPHKNPSNRIWIVYARFSFFPRSWKAQVPKLQKHHVQRQIRFAAIVVSLNQQRRSQCQPVNRKSQYNCQTLSVARKPCQT